MSNKNENGNQDIFTKYLKDQSLVSPELEEDFGKDI